MRIAILADIHGNVIALDAVLDDARSAGAEQFWVIGDLCAIGPEPVRVLERLAEMDGVVLTRGNTDRYVVTGEGPPPTLEAVQRDPTLVATYAGIRESFAWTRGFLTAVGRLEALERLPLDFRFSAPTGHRILAVHASPGTDDGEGIHGGRSNAQIEALLAGADEDLILVGHTHEALVRRIGPRTVVNPGSVSNPRAPDLRASYLLLECNDDGMHLEHRRVAYDQGAFEDTIRASGHPAAEFILSHQRGEQPVRAPHADATPVRTGERIRIDS
jgi:putative phosphoesterase